MMGGSTLFILTIDIVHVSDSGEVTLQYNNNITCIACIKCKSYCVCQIEKFKCTSSLRAEE